jgi:hypothetical protein
MKKSRLLEIIREEISAVLNEAPIYDINDMEGFKSTLKKFKEEEVSKSKALNLLLTKLEDEGTVDTNQLSKDMGVDSATFNNKEIRKFLNRPKDEEYTDKSGKELIDFTPFLGKSDKTRGRKASEKPESEEKPKIKSGSKNIEKPKNKSSEKTSSTDMDDEDKEAAKAAGSDETAKALASTPEEKKIKFNQFLASVKKNKEDKAKIDGILKLAKVKFKFPKSMIDDLKRAAGRQVEA